MPAGHALARELVADDPEREREDAAAQSLDDAADDEQARAWSRALTNVPDGDRGSTITSTRFLPNMSPSRPRIGVATDALSRNAVSTQVTAVVDVPRSVWISRSAGATSDCDTARRARRARGRGT